MTTTPELPLAAWLEAAVRIARDAGAEVLAVYAQDFAVQAKADASPVTEADARAEALIVPRLQALTPGIPVVAEEAVSAAGAPEVGSRFWLVDPLDGTREFIQRNGEFTVNLALVEAGEPVLGVVYAPALGRLYAGARGCGAWMEESGAAGRALPASSAAPQQGPPGDPPQRRSLACRQPPAQGLTVVSSRSHGDDAALQALLRGRRVAAQATAGSSLKLCLVAAGQADLYPRLGRTMEWDIAAGHALLRAAGGEVYTVQGPPLRYGKPGFENPHFVACAQGAWQV